MDTSKHLLIAVNYELYAQRGSERQLMEKTTEERPFVFITGFQMALDHFEDNLSVLVAGDKFKFTLTPSEGFGEYDPEGVHVLPRDAFNVKGHFDKENVYVGAIIAVQNPQGQTFHAQVTAIDTQHVTIDTNHPLAGRLLTFEGSVIENRPATEGEIDQLLKQLMKGDDEEGGGCCGHCHHEDAGEHHCCHHEDAGEHHCCHHGDAAKHHCCHKDSTK